MQAIALQHTGTTFAVDRVKPATELLPESRMYEAVDAVLGSKVESCCDYDSTVVAHIDYHPLLAAVYKAFSEHRPLVLTPDAVWITIAQGVAHHMTTNAERLRSRFVLHEGKLDFVYTCAGWEGGLPVLPWPEAFDDWAGHIRDHVGADIHDLLVCDFSTTGPVEYAASQIVMMDVFERYFHYVAHCICGIPTITLEGTPDDWQHLADKAARLSVFDLEWWLEHLLPICEQFVRASRGDVDRKHWQNICKRRDAYGGDIINGWVAKLFPYLRAFAKGPCNRQNPIFETGDGLQTSVAPSGLSRVPVTWVNPETGLMRGMEAIGGLVGMTQDPETLALRPKVGWAVREAEKMDQLLARLAAEHTTFPGFWIEGEHSLPPNMAKFYFQTNGADLSGTYHASVCRIIAASDCRRLHVRRTSDDSEDAPRPRDYCWHRFAWLADGSWLAINLDTPYCYSRSIRRLELLHDPNYNVICRGKSNTSSISGDEPVVALSFTELLERLLDNGGQPYWPDPEFKDYGDADSYTRRN